MVPAVSSIGASEDLRALGSKPGIISPRSSVSVAQVNHSDGWTGVPAARPLNMCI